MSVALGILLHFGTWLPFGFITPDNYFVWSVGTKIAISLVPNLGFYFGFLMTWFKETDGSAGMTWDAAFKPVGLSDNLTLADIWLSHIITSIIFLVLLWYMDNVRPGKFGVAQPFYFPFTVHFGNVEKTTIELKRFLTEILLVRRTYGKLFRQEILSSS